MGGRGRDGIAPLQTQCRGERDLRRVAQLVDRYETLQLGFSDAAVIACAERHEGRILTADRRDFDVVAGEGRIAVLPE